MIWRKVETEGLPKKEGYYLIITVDDYVHEGVAFLWADGRWTEEQWQDGTKIEVPGEIIKFWAPAPETPEEVRWHG